jgi:acetolactate synthase-1/2/3 large subunit
MSDSYTVSDLIAEFLEACGVSTAFGIVSVHNIPMLDTLSQRNTMRFVTTRGEAGAAHMADGYARASGGLGCVFTSTGPGAANAVSGLVEARFAGTPLLHITGQTSTRFVDRGMGTVHDVPDQLGMLRASGKAA